MPCWQDSKTALKEFHVVKELRPPRADINLPSKGTILEEDPWVPVKPSEHGSPANILTETSEKTLGQK